MNDIFTEISFNFISQPITKIIMYLLIYFVVSFIMSSVLGRILSWVTPTKWSLHIKRFKHPSLLLVLLPALWLVFSKLSLEGQYLKISTSIVKSIFYICIFWVLYSASNYLFSGFRIITAKTQSKLDDQLLPVLEKISRFLILSLGLLLVLQSFGLDVFSLIAGLGLGGLALALAAKDTASNFFGSLMILLDQPFNIGDWIKTGDIEGTVEDIGLRSTRIRTFYNSLVVVPNSIIAMSTLDNLGQREYRRFRHVIGLEYETPAENIQTFIQSLKETINNNPNTWDEKTEVTLNSLGDSSVEVLVYVFFSVEDWSQELAERQKLIFDILELSKTHKAPIAYPTQTLHLAKPLPTA